MLAGARQSADHCISPPRLVHDPVTPTVRRDPTCAPQRQNDKQCEHKLYPNADEVLFCGNPAVWGLVGPCCSYVSYICDDCKNLLPKAGWWQCNACGRRTNAPTRVVLRRLVNTHP